MTRLYAEMSLYGDLVHESLYIIDTLQDPLPYILFLYCSSKKVLISIVFCTYSAVILINSGSVIILTNFDSDEILKYALPTIGSMFFRNIFLCFSKVLQIKRKCISSSIRFGQKGQYLLLFSIFKCLPFSIISVWFESLNFVRATLFCTEVTSVRYFSYPMSSLNKP